MNPLIILVASAFSGWAGVMVAHAFMVERNERKGALLLTMWLIMFAVYTLILITKP